MDSSAFEVERTKTNITSNLHTFSINCSKTASTLNILHLVFWICVTANGMFLNVLLSLLLRLAFSFRTGSSLYSFIGTVTVTAVTVTSCAHNCRGVRRTGSTLRFGGNRNSSQLGQRNKSFVYYEQCSHYAARDMARLAGLRMQAWL